ncbi:hypothetical protein PT015_03555 [Candidatus Mycobacterium wuenschmannii]|uniref:Uncharacterized protein n=1 Tax=Candidatus Mycobacterium wuenschmannii TaxID=3027808 RepID=A0ABY8W2D0_9MYCO|nr:hypothetical protein [Candidatus Mycobacterium wuenschmannii]WIM88583.1 hypothetical protein PT015_03555 [Candidatus Mycobacterium wuenschmannii]
MPRLVFNGHIAGFGTRAGTRFVVGSWLESPFGRFADVMVEEADGRRSLLAPNADVAEFVSATYMFDSIELGDVTVQQSTDAFRVSAPGLTAEGTLGGAAPFDWLLRWVPARLASAPAWLRAIDPVAARLVPGVRTAGSAGSGRREYYGVRRARRIASVAGTFRGVDLAGLADLDPPVRFGFSSAPATPQLVSVTTTIDVP